MNNEYTDDHPYVDVGACLKMAALMLEGSVVCRCPSLYTL